MVTPMTVIPVLLHIEVESQTVEFESSEFDMCVGSGSVDYGM